MRMGYLMFLIFIIMSGLGLAADIPASTNTTQAIFTQVQGKVQVLVPNRKKPKKAQKDLVVTQGDRIMTQEDSSAVLRLFDGSELKVDSKTEFVLSEMQKPSDEDKKFKFSLFIGKLAAVVKKLTSASSSFEIEAGGVVCGVRGTKFSMNCDGKHNPQVQLHVFEGIVYTIDGKGNKFLFHPGPPIKFVNAQQTDNTKPNNPPGGNNNNGSDKNTGLNDLNGQFQSNIGLNQNKTLNTTQGGTNITIKPVVGN